MTKSTLKPMTALLIAALSTTPATAQETRMVSYADLDLATSAGQSSLANRIHTAARRVCADGDVSGLASQQWHKACVAEAQVAAQRQVALILARRSVERVALGC